MISGTSQVFKRVLTHKHSFTNSRQLLMLTKQTKNLTSLESHSKECSHSFLRFEHTKTVKCWKCGVEKDSIKHVFCPKCNFIQEPHEKDNFFYLFDLQESFDIDVKNLTNQYRKLQNVIHPDKFSTKSNEELNISQEYSSLINKAYNTLQFPLNRALHMLQLKGEKIDEDQKIIDMEFLAKIMEINEEVEKTENPEDLRQLNQVNKKTIEEICQKISNAFKKNNIEEAKKYIVQLKYFNSISHHINGIMRDKGIMD